MHGSRNVRAFVAACLAATCAFPLGCKKKPVDPGPDLQIVGESTRIRLEDPVPASTPWLVDGKVILVAARGETLGIQVLHRVPGPVSLTITATATLVRGYSVDSYPVKRASTSMYGGGRTGTFADGLMRANPPLTNPAYFEIDVFSRAEPGEYKGELAVGDRKLPVSLTVTTAKLPATPPRVWAYDDPRELAWMAGAPPDTKATPEPTLVERACAETFAENGVALMPDLHIGWWPARKPPENGLKDLPVVIPADPATAGDVVKAWIAATKDTGLVPFAIPIDEPGTPEARAKVVELAKVVRAAGGGPTTFRFALTDDPRPEYGDLIDLYISLRTPRSHGGKQWTYNGAPPRAGSMVLDAETPGARTWGWIAHLWNIPVWYVWDALYWHDRHNRKGAPLPGKPLEVGIDPTSFEKDEDHGNLDGVLALPGAQGCRKTLRLASIRRGQQDRVLLEQASACDAAKTKAIAEKMIPTALGDAPAKGDPPWPTDESAWELARRELIAIAASCTK